ncbi:hypothetical protein [Aeromonas hydrophila]|uniref:hypothetical protein n=1 Tax=Aeromonas hydrophila TaxID=644 RepID=UPI0005731B57|nr:hypothetical protein [Aeromonas hydrophila]KHN59944.1 hypothetical protein OI72_05395 [Aeromonas hydrophila]OFC42763.1 hypothetical protein BA189_04425 [Aeromonas hydrophila]OFC52659.1 hypothetical protein BA188_11735 [Aeromonas hydrophila]
MTPEERLTAWDALGLNYGDFISHADMRRMLGLERPFPELYHTGQEYDAARDDYEWQVLSSVSELRELLLTERKIYLDIKRGQGYELAHPSEQIAIATKQYAKALERETHKLVEVSVNVNLDVLDTSQRHRVTQQQDRVAALADFMGRGKQLTISVTSA